MILQGAGLTILDRKTRLLVAVRLAVARSARFIRQRLPRRLAGNRRTWAEGFIASPEDTERAVEIPWAASAVASCVGLWLDVGYAHAEPRYWEAVQFGPKRRWVRVGYGIDIAQPQGQDGLDVHLVADIIDSDPAALPRFDLVTCVSTLEHFGCDNTRYLPEAPRRDQPFGLQKRALTHMLSSLAPRGRLLISVPYGKFQDNGWFLNYNQAMVQELVDVATANRGAIALAMYYRLREDGWERCDPEGLAGLEYRAEGRAAAVALLEFAAP